VNAPVLAVVAPIVVPLIEPPVIVAPELDSVFSVAVDDAVSVVKAPVDGVVAPTVVPLMLPPVIVALEEVTAPLKAALIVPALKLPEASRATIAFAVFAFVAVVAEFATLPAVLIVASFVSTIPAAAAMSLLTMLFVRASFE
jgi:hypothetical protein